MPYQLSLHKKIFLVIAILLSACSPQKKYDKSKAISLIDISTPKVEPNLPEITLPTMQNSQSFFFSKTQPENISKNFTSKKSWLYGDFYYFGLHNLANSFYFANDVFVTAPQIDNNQLFTLSANGYIKAYNLHNNELIWQKKAFNTYKNYRLLNISLCNNKLITTSGDNNIMAFDSKNGKLLWHKQLSAPLSSAVVCNADLLFLLSDNNKTFALQQSSGDLAWFHQGIVAQAGIFGATQPFLWQNKLLVAYATGEIYALQQNNGNILWSINSNINNINIHQDDLYDANISSDGKTAFILRANGLLQAIQLANGKQLWQLQATATADASLVADYLFVINTNNLLMAINKNTGKIKWQSKLPSDKQQIYNGSTMAGDKLLITSQNGDFIIVNPINGLIETSFNLQGKIFHKPIVVNDAIYLHVLHKFTSQLFVLK